MLKKGLTFLFSIIYIIILSQDKFKFDYKLFYKIDNREQVWYVSSLNNNIYKVTNLNSNYKNIYYNGYYSSFESDNINDINYNSLHFLKENENQTFEIVNEEKTKIGKYDCDKYVIKSGNNYYEFFVTKNKIDNTAYLYSILQTPNKNIFKSGIIVKINVRHISQTEFKSFFNLEKIERISLAEVNNYIDIKELDKAIEREEKNKIIRPQTTEVEMIRNN